MQKLLELIDYFDLRVDEADFSVERGKRRHTSSSGTTRNKRGAWWWNLLVYLLIVLGVAGKFLFDFWQQARPISGLDLTIAFVIGALVFPAVYKSTGMSPDKPSALQFFLAFQNGFFWQTLVGGLLRGT